MPFRAAVFASLLLALPSLAEELTPEKAAVVDRDQKKAQDQVQKKYGGKKSSELSSDERRAMIRDQAEADRNVLDKHGVSAKELSRYSAGQSRDDRARQADAAAALEKKEKEDDEKAKQQAAAGAAPPKEIPIQRGFSDENAVELEAKEGAPPVVEQGLTADDQKDFEAAAGATSPSDDDKKPTPAKAGKGKGKGKRGR